MVLHGLEPCRVSRGVEIGAQERRSSKEPVGEVCLVSGSDVPSLRALRCTFGSRCQRASCRVYQIRCSREKHRRFLRCFSVLPQRSLNRARLRVALEAGQRRPVHIVGSIEATECPPTRFDSPRHWLNDLAHFQRCESPGRRSTRSESHRRRREKTQPPEVANVVTGEPLASQASPPTRRGCHRG